MVCSKCGQFNEKGQNFCRFCGASLTPPKTETYAPPRPHGWASPSSPLHDVAGYGETSQVQPLANVPDVNGVSHPHITLGYRCPHCGTSAPPQITRSISTGGWVVFVVMLLLCFPLFWIGFLIKEENRVCSMCMTKLG
jgi:hypothetical protein